MMVNGEDNAVIQLLRWANLIVLGLTAKIVLRIIEMLTFRRAEAGEFLASPVKANFSRSQGRVGSYCHFLERQSLQFVEDQNSPILRRKLPGITSHALISLIAFYLYCGISA